jgi:hypothetical protein
MRFIHEAVANAMRTMSAPIPSDLIWRRSVTFGRRNDSYGENITSLRLLRYRPGRTRFNSAPRFAIQNF